ncbi:MAG: NAD(P)-binding domain-containing protein, partial [Rhodobacterales bacterium]
MGAPMATNLVKAGHKVIGFDVALDAVPNITMVETAAMAVQNADAIITMLPNGTVLRSVADQILPVMKRGALFIDCSTVDFESAREIADQANNFGIMFVDAPVSGGING